MIFKENMFNTWFLADVYDHYLKSLQNIYNKIIDKEGDNTYLKKILNDESINSGNINWN